MQPEKTRGGNCLFWGFFYSRSWFYNDWSNSLCLLTRIFTFARQLQLLPTKVLKLKNSQLKIGGEAESCKNPMLYIILFPKTEWSCLLRYLIRGSGPSLAFFCWQLVWGSLLFCHFYFTMHCKQTEVSVLKTSLFKFKDRITLLSTCLASISYIFQIRNALSDIQYVGETFTNYKKFHSIRSLPGCFHKKSTLILHKTLLQKQALGYRERRGQGGRREKVPSESDNLHSFFFFFIFLPGWLVLHCTTYKPRSPSFLFLFSFSQFCEGVCGCGGLVSARLRPAGVFMVYFWPQQQKACWCSKSVAPIVSITLLLNRLAPLSLAHWQTLPSSAHAAILIVIL